MKKHSHRLWLFTHSFFIFLSVYLIVKFICIFFLSAGYEPAFIFQLTPFYLLSGLSNVQLLALSLLLMVFDLSLHLWASKRHLLLSFLPTSLMIVGVGYTMMFSPLDRSYVFHYILFGCLMLVVLIDYQYLLKGVAPLAISLKKKSKKIRMMEEEPSSRRTKSLFIKNVQVSQQPLSPLLADSIVELKKVSDTILQKMQIISQDLDRKTLRIEQLEDKFEEQKHILSNQKPIIELGSSSIKSKEKDHISQKPSITSISTEEQIILKEKIKNHLIIDERNDTVAVIQRGVFKEISNSCAGFLGYKRTELLEKNFFVFIAPRGFEDARRYYLNRLKGITTNSFRTIVRTKAQNELNVEITVTPTIYKGDSAEFLCIKEVKT
jgi:PAS domain S-box-containing protein